MKIPKGGRSAGGVEKAADGVALSDGGGEPDALGDPHRRIPAGEGKGGALHPDPGGRPSGRGVSGNFRGAGRGYIRNGKGSERVQKGAGRLTGAVKEMVAAGMAKSSEKNLRVSLG